LGKNSAGKILLPTAEIQAPKHPAVILISGSGPQDRDESLTGHKPFLVLAVVGTKDTQVLPDLNMPEIEKALAEGGKKDFEIIRLEGLNHLFQECETGASGEYVTIQETFNQKALVTIGDRIIRHTTPVK
jgi:hypothetical protein